MDLIKHLGFLRKIAITNEFSLFGGSGHLERHVHVVGLLRHSDESRAFGQLLYFKIEFFF